MSVERFMLAANTQILSYSVQDGKLMQNGRGVASASQSYISPAPRKSWHLNKCAMRGVS